MSGPGVYVPDVTEGITRVEDLPQPRIKLRSRNFSCRRCPFCGLGVTTDGSELYPEPLKELWPDVPHQVCEFHVIKEITKAVLHALAATRKKLRDRIPKQPRGRPRKAERAQSRKATRQQQQVSKLFEHRYLFVQHRLTADQKTTLQRITRGLAHLRRLRQIMEEVYRLFDRRCRTETALA